MARLRALLLLLITGLGGALRVWQLDTIPPGFHFDEAYEALEAWRVATQTGYHPLFFPGNFGVEPIFIYLTSVAFALFGAEPTVMRGVAALLGTLTIPLLYGAGRELLRADALYGERGRLPAALPWLAALALAIQRWHIHFSRVGIEPVLVPLFLVLVLWAFWRAWRVNDRPGWLALGLAIGLSLYSYQSAWLLPFLPLVLAATLWAADRARFRTRLPGLLVAAGVAALLFLPLGFEFWRNPAHLFLRGSQIAVAEATPSGGLADNALRALAMFTLRGDLDPRSNVPGLPLLDPALSVAFVLGLLLTLQGLRRPTLFALLAALLILLLPTLLSDDAPHFRRSVGAAPAVALLCGLGLAWVLGYRSRSAGGWWRQGRAALVGALLGVSAVWAAHAYFVLWGPSAALYYAYDEGLWQVGQFVQQLPAEVRVYITPRPASDATLAFAWRQRAGVHHFDGRYAFPAPAYAPLAGQGATYVVIEHEDFRGAGLLRALYPGASEVAAFRDRRGGVYARAFQVPPDAERGRLPQYPVQAAWPEVELVGYDLNEPVYKPGDIIYLQLWWRVLRPIDRDWTVFTHLLRPQPGAEDPVLAGHDAQPGEGSVPTSTWQMGELVLDEHQIRLPGDTAPGVYPLEVGLYDLAAGAARARLTQPAGQDHLMIGQVRVQ